MTTSFFLTIFFFSISMALNACRDARLSSSVFLASSNSSSWVILCTTTFSRLGSSARRVSCSSSLSSVSLLFSTVARREDLRISAGILIGGSVGVVETEIEVGVESRALLAGIEASFDAKDDVVIFFLGGGIDAACLADLGRVPPESGIDMDDFPVLRCVSMACCFLRAFASSGSSANMLSSSSAGSSSALDWSKSESTISSSSVCFSGAKGRNTVC